MVYLESDTYRVSCPEHGVVVTHVPWARPAARHTHAFEDTVAWWTARAAASTVAEFLRITWRTVQAIVERVVTERAGKTDLLAGLRRIGIEEIAYRKGQRYLTCVVDHDTGKLVWAAQGRNSETILKFFDALGEERTKELHPRLRRRCRVDPQPRPSQSTTSGAVHGSLPYRRLGHQGRGQGTPRHVEHPARRRKHRPGQ
jgi:transposase